MSDRVGRYVRMGPSPGRAARSDEAASDHALSSDFGGAAIGDVLALLAGPPELVALTPLGGAGLPR